MVDSSITLSTSLPAVECDMGLLRIAVGNLLRNAITYGRKGGEIRVGLAREKRSKDW